MALATAAELWLGTLERNEHKENEGFFLLLRVSKLERVCLGEEEEESKIQVAQGVASALQCSHPSVGFNGAGGAFWSCCAEPAASPVMVCYGALSGFGVLLGLVVPALVAS